MKWVSKTATVFQRIVGFLAAAGIGSIVTLLFQGGVPQWVWISFSAVLLVLLVASAVEAHLQIVQSDPQRRWRHAAESLQALAESMGGEKVSTRACVSVIDSIENSLSLIDRHKSERFKRRAGFEDSMRREWMDSTQLDAASVKAVKIKLRDARSCLDEIIDHIEPTSSPHTS